MKPNMQTALDFHRRGQLAEAEGVYRRILAQDPYQVETLHFLGVLKLQQAQAGEAYALLTRALEVQPQAIDVLSNMSVALLALNRQSEALAVCERVLAAEPGNEQSLFNRSVALMQLGRDVDALRGFDQVLAQRPDHLNALFNRGNVLAGQGRFDEALASYDRALAVNSGMVVAAQNRGNALVKLGRYAEAIKSFERVLAAEPGNLDARNGCAICRRQLGHHAEALVDCEQVLAGRGDHLGALITRGNVLLSLDRAGEALVSFDRALALVPDDADTLNNRGLALFALQRHEDALASYDRALAANPGNVEVLNNRGVALFHLGRAQEALAGYDAALAGKGDHLQALNNRALALVALGRPEEALACYQRSLAIGPDNADAHKACGTILAALGRYPEALASYSQALTLKPDDSDTLVQRSEQLRKLGRLADAIADCERAVVLDPAHPNAFAALASHCESACDWGRAGELAKSLEVRLSDGRSRVNPFILLDMESGPEAHLRRAQAFAQRSIPFVAPMVRTSGRAQADKIRLGYLSANFAEHPVAYLVSELFERHDRERFDVIGLSFGPNDRGPTRARIAAGFDEFHDVAWMGDSDAAALIDELGIAIAVDLTGHTDNACLGILAHRPAPVQASYLGYPGTLGVDFVDYVIADPIVLPFDEQPFFTEKIVHLPDCYQVNDTKRAIAVRIPSRCEVGLPDDAFVFCCFNNSWKLKPDIFDIWMRLLKSVDGSVLWLFQSNELETSNLLHEVAARGVDPSRLVFAPRVLLADHLARHQLADLAIDTLPYNAHTTGSDALWAGVPMITCAGNSFAGRVAASLLNAVGLPQLVTSTLAEYEALALLLATDPRLLGSLRQKLRDNRLQLPLFDIERTTRHIEAAYVTMWEIWQRGEAPRSFKVDPIGT